MRQMYVHPPDDPPVGAGGADDPPVGAGGADEPIVGTGGAGGAPPALDSSEPLQLGSHEASPFVGICSHADGPGHVEDWPDGVWLMRQI